MNTDRAHETITSSLVDPSTCDPVDHQLAPRTIPNAHGGPIIVRSVRPGDEAALGGLYEGLDADDRYRRFLCIYRPQPEFFEQLANPGPREARVVAQLSGPTGPQLVGEAGYTLLANGNGEFAMVVERDWRGRLGSHLLDGVVELAAAHGVPNLEAEVLAANTSMLALLRARGCVVVDRDGWNEYRMMVGTGDDGPTWGEDLEHPRVLVEASGGRWPLEGQARSAGLRVITCYGPVQNPLCPELSGRRCPLAGAADVIVVRSLAGDRRWADMTSAHTRLHPDVTVVLDDRAMTTLDDVRIPGSIHFHLQTLPKSKVSNDRE
jgi:hypothetical protein